MNLWKTLWKLWTTGGAKPPVSFCGSGIRIQIFAPHSISDFMRTGIIFIAHVFMSVRK